MEGCDPIVTDSIRGKLHITWPLKSMEGTLIIDVDEKQIAMKVDGGKSNNWFLDLTTADNAKLPFKEIKSSQVNCSFEGMNYSIKAVQGSFLKLNNGTAFRITPQNNSVVLNFADTNPAQ